MKKMEISQMENLQGGGAGKTGLGCILGGAAAGASSALIPFLGLSIFLLTTAGCLLMTQK